MTPVGEAFMLQADEKLDFDTMAKIFRQGYSRIPIYDKGVDDIVGLMLVKDLVFLDPNDRLPVRSFLRRFARHIQVREDRSLVKVPVMSPPSRPMLLMVVVVVLWIIIIIGV